MLCYKDKCFCSFYLDCKCGNKCHRALTQEVIDEANKCNMPIDRFIEKPSCFWEVGK